MRQHIPNFVTGLRIVLTPLIAFVIWQPQSAFLAALALFLFIIAGASDWLDGYLARQMNIVSPIGRMLDPIADKLLVAACLLALAAGRVADAVFLVPALIILMREFWSPACANIWPVKRWWCRSACWQNGKPLYR